MTARNDIEERCIAVADTVVPKYRHGTRAYSCGGHVARMWQAAYDGAAALIAAPPATDDTRIVPLEPTREMWAAGGNAIVGYKHRHHDKVVSDVWSAMLAAAPKVASEDQAARDRRMYEQGKRDERAGEPEAFI